MKKALVLLVFIVFSNSCVKDIDVDQIETAVFSIPASIALLQLDLNPIDFIDTNANEIEESERLFLIDLSDLFKGNSTDSLLWETKFLNTFNRDFICQFEFLPSDIDSEPLMITDPFPVLASSSPIQAITFENEQFDLFTSTRWIMVRVSLESGLPFDSDDDYILSIQSVIHFDYELEP